MQFSDWIYLPPGREYAVPLLGGLAAFLLLSPLGLPGGKPLTWPQTDQGFGVLVLFGLLVSTLNAVLLWTHIRPNHLTWQTGRQKFIGTYAVLTIVSIVLSGLALIAKGEAEIAILGARSLDFPFTLKCLDLGLVGLTPALGLTAIWRSETPGIGKVRSQRDCALKLATALINSKITRDDFDRLPKVVDNLLSAAEGLEGSLRTPADRRVLDKWREGAAETGEAIRYRAYQDRDDISKEAVRQGIVELEARI